MSDISVVTPVLFLSLFAWYIFLYPFIFNLFTPLKLKYVPSRQYVVGSFLFIHFSVYNFSLYYLIHKCNYYEEGFMSANLLLVSICLLSFLFLYSSIIALFYIQYIFSLCHFNFLVISSIFLRVISLVVALGISINIFIYDSYNYL